ncbi:MAG: polysaccharide deacetylase family protein [Patescibacteria group bacterium]|nr:polysaccharide deacetylase family protein [Patescibacteria group bacterium]
MKYIFLFFQQNKTILIACLVLYLFTIVIVNQKKIILSYNQQKDRPIAEQPLKLFSNLDWGSYYGGSFGYDRAIALTDKSVRVSTGIDGGWYGARANLGNQDFSNQALRFAVRFEDISSLDTFLILLATDHGRFENYFSFNVRNFFSSPAANEWQEVVVLPSAFQIAEGDPDWSRVTDVALRVVAKPGVYTRVWFDGLASVDNNFSPIITMTFDDGFQTTVAGAEIMKEYGFMGTAYIMPTHLGTDKYLSQDEVDYLHGLGWDISGHGHTDLRLYSSVDADSDLARMRDYLLERDYRGKEHFAYPNGGYNDLIRSLTAEYFQTARTIDGFSQPQGYIIPSKINAKTISVTTPVAQIKDWIDRAIAEKSWLILTWHDLVAAPATDVEYDIVLFAEVVQYLDSLDVKVLPFSAAYDIVSQSR